MKFSSENEVREFYNAYALNCGFSTCKATMRNGEDGKMKYFTIACAKNGFKASRSKNILKPRPSTKTRCKAKINIVVRGDAEYVITSVCLDHNHMLSPTKSRHLRSHIVLDEGAKRRLELNDEAGITLAKSFQSFVVEAGGYDNLHFDERSCRNFIAEARRLRLGNGDGEALNNYFCRMQSSNTNFHYSIDLDEDSRIRNVFWADGRSRAAYECFSDVITFDTTYLTNRYDMPFAPFVGVNHHGQSILLGCGLLSSEDSESFIWLFKSWLTCMLGRAPNAIITDQCRAMAIAIETVFPNSHHRYCLWHIMKKIPTKFGAHAEYKLIKKTLKSIVYNSITTEECEENWMKMLKDFKLEGNDWLNALYAERAKWIPVYVKCHFWAGMSTSQRSESINAFFDDYINSKTSLKQFVEQYDRALKKNIERETVLDFQSFNSSIPIVSGFALERQFQSLYTNAIFKLFQNELRGLMFCNTVLSKLEGTTSIFQVVETCLGINGEHSRDISYKVWYTDVDCGVKCQCQLFEFRGILCRHIIAVLTVNKVNEVPMYYILDRWRKDLKRRYQIITNIYDSEVCEGERNRYNILTTYVQQVHYLGARSEENCSELIEALKALTDKFMERSNVNQSMQGSTSTDKLINSPRKVRARGRPPTKRKLSNLEVFVAKARARKKTTKSTAQSLDVSSQLSQAKSVSTTAERRDDPMLSQPPSTGFEDVDYMYYVERR